MGQMSDYAFGETARGARLEFYRRPPAEKLRYIRKYPVRLKPKMERIHEGVRASP